LSQHWIGNHHGHTQRPLPRPTCSWYRGPLSGSPFGAGWWLTTCTWLSCPSWSRKGWVQLVKKMEIPQALCLNSCSSVRTDMKSVGLRSRGRALTPLFPEPRAARRPTAWAPPCTLLGLGPQGPLLTFFPVYSQSVSCQPAPTPCQAAGLGSRAPAPHPGEWGSLPASHAHPVEGEEIQGGAGSHLSADG
jgi:hypothetical protein